jgi:hypothetical protein
MRSVDSNIVDAWQSEELRPFHLLYLNIDSTDYRYTDCDVPIAVGGNLYDPRGFRAESVTYSLNKIVDQIQLSIDNLDDTFTSPFVGGTPQGSTVILDGVVLGSDYQPLGSTSITLFEGTIDQWGLSVDKLEITVSSLFSQWKQKTQARQSASCRWKKFKGTECGYSGAATWCDRTYTRCQALGNTANFGGERFLPSIVDRVVWWGRTPS